MAAWRIFIHSVQMIFNNLPQVVRIVLVPMGIGIAAIALFAVLGVSMDGTDSEGATGGQIAGMILLALVLIWRSGSLWRGTVLSCSRNIPKVGCRCCERIACCLISGILSGLAL